MHQFDHILIIDYGSQVTQLIARKIREHKVYNTVVPYDKVTKQEILPQTKGIILSGGHDNLSSDEHDAPSLPKEMLEANLPILGICYGMQLMCHLHGGKVSSSSLKEFGHTLVTIEQNTPLLEGVWQKGKSYSVFMSHGDSVSSLPSSFMAIASTETCPYAVVAHKEKPFYGVQFHPEVHHTPDGSSILQNFVTKVCKARTHWTPPLLKISIINKLRETIGDEKRVICALSGGIDSMVTAKLLFEAIGDRLLCVYVDHGLMRLGETEQISALFEDHFGCPLSVCKEEERFLTALDGVDDPEEKRKIIGHHFISVFEEQANAYGHIDFLAQGTLYPDVIESGGRPGSKAVKIKSHHNVGGLPSHMNLKLIEPLRDLFKDEVRTLGIELGLPENFIARHPFPGPGLAVRIPGNITKEKCDILRKVDHLYIEFLKEQDLYHQIWQAFAVLLPVRSVGVMGDARTYGYSVALRAVSSTDGMTAKSSNIPMEALQEIADKIVNSVTGVNRVLYDLSSKPPGTIEWE